jgi:hypothetical protein
LNEPDDPHISSESLENFVLERLSPAGRAMVENHLATCASCRDALEEERYLAAGIRSSGRSALKRRLAESLTAPDQQPAPWGRIVIAAAVLVVIAGIGLVYRWLTPVEQAPQVAEAIAPAQADKAPRDLPSSEKPEASRPSKEEREFKAKREAPKALTGQTASRAAGTPSKDVLMENSVTGAAESPEAASALSSDHSIWQTGLLTENTASDQYELLLKSDQQAAPHAAGAQMQKRQDLGGRVQTIPRAIVRVSPLIDLPPSETASRTRVGTHEIPTQISQEADSIVFTLYTDLAIEGKALRDAHVRQIAPDSIVLLIGARSISYKLLLPATR